MSIHWIARVWKSSTQKGSAKLLMQALADSANDDGIAWPGKEHLALKIGLTERSVTGLVHRCEKAGEIAVMIGGKGAKHTNRYYILLGRPEKEIEAIKRMVKAKNAKGEKFSPYPENKGEDLVKGEIFSLKNSANKGEAGFTRSLISNDQETDEWMNDDPICVFLKTLPDFNTKSIEATRRDILSHGYPIDELQFLWQDARDKASDRPGSDANPVGLLLTMLHGGQHSARYQDEQLERRRREQIEREHAELPSPDVESPEDESIVDETIVIDESVNQPYAGTRLTAAQIWQAAVGELQLQIPKVTFDTWIKPTEVVSANGTLKVAVPNQAAINFLDAKLKPTLRRILAGISGKPIEPEFIVSQSTRQA